MAETVIAAGIKDHGLNQPTNNMVP
ncbi:unnamed protein product, partial [Rotaria sp. Silwood1]